MSRRLTRALPSICCTPFPRLFGNRGSLHKNVPRASLRSITTSDRDTMANQPDYSAWSNADLIKRVTELETQLRTRTAEHSSSAAAPRKKLRKAPNKFNPDKYTTRLIALKFAYLGGNYNGFEHHLNNPTPLPTIEEEIWKALNKTRLILPTGRKSEDDEEVSWEGCEYSKCGRTDRGVSAFGQVVGVRVRSNRPKAKTEEEAGDIEEDVTTTKSRNDEKEFDPIRDELPYVQIINRVLPHDIRILAWCPDPPSDFSARFSCRERRYRYFFTNPAYIPLPGAFHGVAKTGPLPEGWLDIDRMREAARKYQGLHDFRNFCKIDPTKQITNFERRIFHADIHEVPSHEPSDGGGNPPAPKLHYFEVRGSAFLWHQVRHLVAMLFLVGQRLEEPTIIDELLDTQKNPAKPLYDMASDVPLVLWDCIFPKLDDVPNGEYPDHTVEGVISETGYEDALNWVFLGQEEGAAMNAGISGEAKYGRSGIMVKLWSLWRQRKMDEVLAWKLLELVANQGDTAKAQLDLPPSDSALTSRIFNGSDTPKNVGTYVPVLQRARLEEPDVINSRYAMRKGLDGSGSAPMLVDSDEAIRT